MLTKAVTYTNFDGEEVTENLYFNLTKTEIVRLEAEYGVKGGLNGAMRRIIEANDPQKLIAEFEKIVLLAYGERSEDGKRFMKTPEIKEAFTQTAAYDAVFMELATDDQAAAAFMLAIIPEDMRAGAAEGLPELDVTVPAPPPPPMNPPEVPSA